MIRLIAGGALIVGLVVASAPTKANAASVLRVPGDYPWIFQAVEAAVPGDTVLISPGHYVEAFTVPSGVTVRSEGGPAITSIELYHNGRVRVQGGTLEGFTFVFADNSSVLLESPGGLIRHNILTSTVSGQTGSYAALAVTEGVDAVVDGNVFRDLPCDPAHASNSAIQLHTGPAVISNNVIFDTDCTGILLGATLADSGVTVVNNTLVGNARGVVIRDGGGGTGKVFRNNIITDGGSGLEVDDASLPTWTDNVVYGNTQQFSGMADPTGTNGNLAVDPAFLGSGPSPYRLTAGSPAIDAGTATDAPTADLFGTARPLDGDGDLTADFDIGAYEYGGVIASIGGVVASRSTGTGVEDICVVALAGGGAGFGTHTAADGSFSLEVIPDDYEVRFTDCLVGAYADQWWNDVAESGLATTFTVATGEAVTGIDGALDISATCNGRLATLVGTASSDVITGTDGDDVIVSFDGADVIDSLLGDDTVCAGGGDDVIRSHDGIDYVSGGTGADNINGGAGDDQLFGDDGADVIRAGSGDDQVSGGDGDDTVYGASGHDTLNGDDHLDTLYGGSGVDTLDGGEGNDTVIGGTQGDTILGGYGDDALDGEQGNDDIDGGVGDDVIRGGGGDDAVVGGWGEDMIKGGPGDDNLSGGRDDDTLEGGGGADILDGNDGRDTIAFTSAPRRVVVDLRVPSVRGDGADTLISVEGIIGSPFGDVLRGTDFKNEIVGGGGNDKLYGYRGDDRLFGGPGKDRLYDGPGDDHNDGGAGNDLIVSQAGRDTMWGGDGYDTVTFADAPRAITLNRLRTAVGHGRDSVDAERIVGSRFDDDLTGFQDIDGLGGNDILWSFGDNGATLRGGSGDDVIHGEQNDEIMYGGPGDDVLWGDEGEDILDGGPGRDELHGGDGADLLVGGGGSDTLIGDNEDDIVLGGAGSDSLAGGNDDDLLLGGDGDDTLDGNNGDDTLAGESGHDRLVGGIGSDTASFAFADRVTVSLTGGWAVGDGNDTLSTLEWIVGSEGDDTLTGSASPNLIEGRGGNDTISGLDASDLLIGSAGNDTISGGTHNDFLYGDQGTDTLNGGSGSDECYDGESHTSCETTGPAPDLAADRLSALGPRIREFLGHEHADRVVSFFAAF